MGLTAWEQGPSKGYFEHGYPGRPVQVPCHQAPGCSPGVSEWGFLGCVLKPSGGLGRSTGCLAPLSMDPYFTSHLQLAKPWGAGGRDGGAPGLVCSFRLRELSPPPETCPGAGPGSGRSEAPPQAPRACCAMGQTVRAFLAPKPWRQFVEHVLCSSPWVKHFCIHDSLPWQQPD